VNGQPGAIVRDRDDQVVKPLSLDVLDGRAQTIRSVLNLTSSGTWDRSPTPGRSSARPTRSGAIPSLVP
jgi:hypothetical protein